MNRNPYAAANVRREQRHQAYVGSPLIGDRFPDFSEVCVEFTFTDPTGLLTPSPQRRLFSPDMNAYFDFQCPLRDCTDGGFDLGTEVSGALSDPAKPGTGTRSCKGSRTRRGSPTSRCGLEVHFRVSAIPHAAAPQRRQRA